MLLSILDVVFRIAPYWAFDSWFCHCLPLNHSWRCFSWIPYSLGVSWQILLFNWSSSLWVSNNLTYRLNSILARNPRVFYAWVMVSFEYNSSWRLNLNSVFLIWRVKVQNPCIWWFSHWNFIRCMFPRWHLGWHHIFQTFQNIKPYYMRTLSSTFRMYSWLRRPWSSRLDHWLLTDWRSRHFLRFLRRQGFYSREGVKAKRLLLRRVKLF